MYSWTRKSSSKLCTLYDWHTLLVIKIPTEIPKKTPIVPVEYVQCQSQILHDSNKAHLKEIYVNLTISIFI